MDYELSERCVSNLPRQSIGEIKSIDAIIDGITNKDDCNLWEEEESNPSISRVYKSRNQMVQFYSNHKTTEPSESTLSKRWGSIKSDFNKFYHKTSSPDNIFGSFDYNGIESKSNLVNSKLKADNTFDFCNGSIKSLVPQRLIMDANRRQQDAVKLGTRSTHNLICERKLDEKSIESLNKRFDYYALKKAEKYNQKIAEKEQNENDQIEFLKKNRIGSIHSTFTPEL